MIVDDDFLERQACQLRRDRLGASDDLIADPDLAGVGANVHGAVRRLHRRMGEERHVIGRVEPRPPASALTVSPRSISGGTAPASLRLRRQGRSSTSAVDTSAFGPSSQVMSRAPRPCLAAPHMIADDRDGDRRERRPAGPQARSSPARRLHARRLAAEHWAARKRGDLHARRPCVDTIDGFAIDLIGRVEPFQRLAYKLETSRAISAADFAAASRAAAACVSSP